MSDTEKVNVFGIRHHGPGSARSLLASLKKLEPDCILVEGPPEANELVQHVVNQSMKPPVSLLIYAQDDLKRAVYYPFAVFSPEWQALVYGANKQVPVRFMDLPQSHWLAINKEKEEKFLSDLQDAISRNTATAEDGVVVVDPESKGGDPKSKDGDAASPDVAVKATAKAKSGKAIAESADESEDEDEDGEEHDDVGATPCVALKGTDGHADGNGSSRAEENEAGEETEGQEGESEFRRMRKDPLSFLAKAAGYDDSERWWENLVEHRREDLDVFSAINEAMTTLRTELSDEEVYSDDFEPLREAHMRQTIRAAVKEGFQRIAVVCGAWHVPALQKMPAAKEDQALLKGLSKMKVESTWIPWTHERLSFTSGYGAGVESPGWYHHLWTCENHVLERWLSIVARLLREEDLDASSAHIIETVRLAEALASMRGQPLPGLREISEAVQAILCYGNDVPMQLIYEKLVVGDLMGEVPPELPGTPLQKNFEQEQKRLRIPAQSAEKTYDLDLRNAIDLSKSHLLHRILLLGIDWGEKQEVSGKSGSFHEIWKVRWMPEYVLKLIEGSIWGKTVEEAANALACDQSDNAKELSLLTQILDKVLLANLPKAVDHVMMRVQTEAAVAVDIKHLMAALPALVQVARYGNVRKTDVESVSKILDGLVSRICVGLVPACSSMNEDAAEEMYELILKVHSAIGLLQNETHNHEWQETLKKIADAPNLNGIIAGRSCRLLFDKRVFDSAESARRFGLALSTANEPTDAAAWADGFLRGSGAILVHDADLLAVVDQWVQELTEDAFKQILPLLRRTFSTYAPPERRQIGERIARSKGGAGARKATGTQAASSPNFSEARADRVLPILSQLLGLGPVPPPTGANPSSKTNEGDK